MKPLYLVLIGLAAILIIFLIYNTQKNRRQSEESVRQAVIATESVQSGPLSSGGSSQVSQVISSLFPYFDTAVTSGLIGGDKPVK
jgi:ABC-type transport system involved in multi-copper enzyme maturation permease subunit